MKTLALYTTITMLLLAGITTIVYSIDLSWDETPMNRDTSLQTLYINYYPECFFATDTYKKEKNKYDYYMADMTGTDGDGPLYTTANIYALIWTNGGEWKNIGALKNHEIDHIPPDYYNYIQPSIKKGLPLGMWQLWEPNRKTGATAYAYAKCTTDYDDYESKYEVYAKIPSSYNTNNEIRKKPPMTLEGTWSDSAWVEGDIDDFEEPITVDSTAKAQAIGKHPSTGENHETEASTGESPYKTEVFCTYCNNLDDNECWACEDSK